MSHGKLIEDQSCTWLRFSSTSSLLRPAPETTRKEEFSGCATVDLFAAITGGGATAVRGTTPRVCVFLLFSFPGFHRGDIWLLLRSRSDGSRMVKGYRLAIPSFFLSPTHVGYKPRQLQRKCWRETVNVCRSPQSDYCYSRWRVSCMGYRSWLVRLLLSCPLYPLTRSQVFDHVLWIWVRRLS
jgi:hypothetical protein